MIRQITPSAITCVLLLAFGTNAFAQCGAFWQTDVGNPGPNSTVWSLLAVDEPSAVGPAVYAGGQFSSAGGVTAKNIARWDGTTWAPLGTGAENGGVVYSMAVADGVLYVGGAFGNMGGITGTKRIAQWDGATWSDVGGGMAENNGGIRALAFFDDYLYAGGYLNEIGGISADKLARWDGNAWSALPGDPLGSIDIVRVLEVYDDGGGDALYVGGEFENAGGNGYADYVFKWDGDTLSPLGQGVNDDVESMAVWNGALYIGGKFTRVYQHDGTELIANKVARWDGTSWEALGTGVNSTTSYYVWALRAFDDGGGEDLYVGGSFTTAGGISVTKLARWDGSAWSAVAGTSLNGYVYALQTSTYFGALYAGGTFTTSGTPSANRIAQWGGPLPYTPINAEADPDTITEGESTELSVSVPGATIEWYTDGCGVTYVGSGDVVTVSPTETTTYYARAFDGSCYSYSCAEVTVTVECALPTITQPPMGGVACAGHGHEMCVTAEGEGELHYQWMRGGLSLVGANLACYTATQAGTYSCVVTDDCGPQESDAAVVVPTAPGAGDFDGDTDADLDDFTLLHGCLAGPDAGVASGCECVDPTGDNRIDLLDLAVFQSLFGG